MGLLLLALVTPAAAKPVGNRKQRTTKPTANVTNATKTTTKPTKATRKPADPKKLGAVARVNFGRELRPALEVIGRSAEVLTPGEDAAAQIQKLLRGPFLRRGVTGLYVADAKTGEPLFSVNAEDPLNPASNVKLISTATALELLGSGFRFPTRVLGPAPRGGIVKGDVYLLGSHDPTLSISDLADIANEIAARGITQIDGNIVVGSDPTRDGIYRAVVPIEIIAGQPGEPPTATLPAGFDLVELKITATTTKRVQQSRLTYKTELSTTPAGQPRVIVTIGGAIGKDGKVTYPLRTKQRTATAVYALIAALRSRAIGITGELKTMELGDFVGDAVSAGSLPVELGRHQSAPVEEIVMRINKWSVNWLSDRLVMTAAALTRRQAPSMALALESMYAWLERHPHLHKSKLVIDTGSGLSYRTQISPRELVSIIRSAGGYTADSDPVSSQSWLRSLSVAGTDGTLMRRFRGPGIRPRIIGKTGTLATAIAISGILELDPQRPLAFALVTNTDVPLSKPLIRRAHEQVIGELTRYLTRTTSRLAPVAPPSVPVAPALDLPDEVEESEPDAALDQETATHR